MKDLIKGLIQYTILHDLIQSDMHAWVIVILIDKINKEMK